jgi:hypothetical protein
VSNRHRSEACATNKGTARRIRWAVILYRSRNAIMVETRWYHYIAWFFGGAFLMNSVPHLVAGVSGRSFQSPFASPPGEGFSTSTVNVVWGMVNLLIAYLLLCRTGHFNLRKTTHVIPFSLGMFGIAIQLAIVFGRLHGGLNV